jgi:hypothetical protein
VTPASLALAEAERRLLARCQELGRHLDAGEDVWGEYVSAVSALSALVPAERRPLPTTAGDGRAPQRHAEDGAAPRQGRQARGRTPRQTWHGRDPVDVGVNPHLDFLLSCLYDDLLHPEHLADLHKSGLTDETIARQKIRTIPPHMIDALIGFEVPKVSHAYLIPFPDQRGGWFDHVRIKVFPSITTDNGTIKYLQRRRSGARIYFPLATLDAVLRSADPLYIVEGEKKAPQCGPARPAGGRHLWRRRLAPGRRP